jgi:hypothetical protein
MVDLDPKYKEVPKNYTCDNCLTEVTPSMHCGAPMHLEDDYANPGTIIWVCWMGKTCGWKEYDSCCDNYSIPVMKVINK